MTSNEFNLEFDIAWNNIMSNQAPGLTLKEKSIFLTQAQELIVRELYSAFEHNEEIRRELECLVEEYTTKNINNNKIPISSLDYELWYIIYETAKIKPYSTDVCKDVEKEVIVKPVTHDVLWEVKRNPFKGPNGNRVLRLLDGGYIELIGENIISYTVRYIRKPNDIDITDVDNDNPCELPEMLHRRIIDTAVNISRQTWLTQKK